MFGTGEPVLQPLGGRWRSWADGVRKEIDAGRIRADVEALPAPRNRLFSPEVMLRADATIIEKFTGAGWPAEKQPFFFKHVLGIVDNSPRLVSQPKVYKDLEGANIVAVKEGVETPGKAVVVLGHYDTVRHSPGANDNTASVAAILELARVLKAWDFRCSVVLATPDMEELWFIGARALVTKLLKSFEIIGVINFETMGYTATGPGTQSVPPGLGLLYKGQIKRIREREFRGDFTCIIYNGAAMALAADVAAALNHFAGPDTALLLRDPNDLPFIGKVLKIAVPAVRNFSRSDHVVFWEKGIAAVQVTDTANFRYHHYHQPTDTVEKVDYRRVADIVAAAATAIAETAGLVRNGRQSPGGVPGDADITPS